jgi:hypothetical protein
VWTQKKELVGDFKNPGRTWRQVADEVLVHDFPQDAVGKAVPYGIYDVTANRGYVGIGTSADTPRFAVEVIVQWWLEEGRHRYPNAKRILILADSGGSNGCRSRVWRQQLQTRLADDWHLEVSVCHYPSGCSKWNKIEHRLFSFISLNWAGKPLRTFSTMLAAIRSTVTRTGLKVSARLMRGAYQLGEKVTDAAMKLLNLTEHQTCPAWNYTVSPRMSSADVISQ